MRLLLVFTVILLAWSPLTIMAACHDDKCAIYCEPLKGFCNEGKCVCQNVTEETKYCGKCVPYCSARNCNDSNCKLYCSPFKGFCQRGQCLCEN